MNVKISKVITKSNNIPNSPERKNGITHLLNSKDGNKGD